MEGVIDGGGGFTEDACVRPRPRPFPGCDEAIDTVRKTKNVTEKKEYTHPYIQTLGIFSQWEFLA